MTSEENKCTFHFAALLKEKDKHIYRMVDMLPKQTYLKRQQKFVARFPGFFSSFNEFTSTAGCFNIDQAPTPAAYVALTLFTIYVTAALTFVYLLREGLR